MTTTLRQQAFASELLAWLNARFARDGITIGAATPLFKDGLINSIRILEIIAWVERALGRVIPDRDIRMDNFATVERIAAGFAREAPDVDG
jgi:acyl carrier protein